MSCIFEMCLPPCKGCMTRRECWCCDKLGDWINNLTEVMTGEYAPVNHGHWIHCDGKSNLWYCSECGEKINYNPTRGTYIKHKRQVHEVNKRCRNCGAKMDGGNDNGKQR